jgi:hypothetical protein
MNFLDRYFSQICTVLFIIGMIVLLMDLWVWRPN